MTSTITHAGGIITPTLIDGYEAERQARNVVHEIINRSAPDVTLRAPGLRRGSLKCVFAAQLDAVAAFGNLSIPQVFTITDTDVPSLGMTFVVPDGEVIRIALDDQTRHTWIVTLPFAEVLP